MNDISAKGDGFASRLMEVLDHVEYRRVETTEDMEDIARLRYKAYKAADVLPVAGKNLIDDADFDDHAYVFGVYYFEELISTIRLHHVTPDHRVSQSAGIFSDAMEAFLDAGLTLIDPARFAADPEIARDMPAIPYLTLRPSIVAAAYFKADRVLQHVRPAHAAFYRRVFYAETVIESRMADIYGFDLTLLATNTHTTGAKLLKRYPFFDSGPYERRLMFGRGPENRFSPLTVLPSARLVVQGQVNGATAGVDY